MNIVRRVFREGQRVAVERAWSMLGPLPFDRPVQIDDQPRAASLELDHPQARAQAHLSTVSREWFPESDGEIGCIRIGDGFLELQDERDRAVVLLHELIHLRLFAGRLRANRAAMDATRRDIPPGHEEQYDLADQLGKCVQEIACDRFAALRYPSFSGPYFDGERREYYRQPNAYLQYQREDSETPDLLAYLTVYRLIRAEAGLAVYTHDPVLLRQLADLREQYRGKLRRDCGNDDAWFLQLCAAKDAIVSVNVESNEPDTADYMELFKGVMSIEAPASRPWSR